MGKCAVLVVLAYCFTCATSSGGQPQEVILLGFGGPRGAHESTTEPLQPFGEGRKLPKNVHVFCSKAEYPNDVYCDVTMLKSHGKWRAASRINSVELEYLYPSSTRTKCLVTLVDSGVKDELVFYGAKCYPSVPDETLPPFGVADVTWLRIDFDREPQCTAFLKQSKNVGRKNWNVEAVGFELRMLLCDQTEEQALGKPAEYRHDGRRFRPNRKPKNVGLRSKDIREGLSG